MKKRHEEYLVQQRARHRNLRKDCWADLEAECLDWLADGYYEIAKVVGNEMALLVASEMDKSRGSDFRSGYSEGLIAACKVLANPWQPAGSSDGSIQDASVWAALRPPYARTIGGSLA